MNAALLTPHVPTKLNGDGANGNARTLIGLATLMADAYSGRDLGPVWRTLLARVAADPRDAAALMDLGTVLQLCGQRERGLAAQAQALEIARVYKRPHGGGGGLRLLAFVVAGDFMANTPVDFLLEESDVDLALAYVDADGSLPPDLPAHDLALVAIGESPQTAPALVGLERALRSWKPPILNGAPGAIAALTRDGVSALFSDTPLVAAPPTRRLTRRALARVDEAAFPIVVRPVGSQAGQGFEKLADSADALGYLARHPDPEFFVQPFVDYASADGRFRKQRIVFVRGEPFICHMAIGEHWMVHYLSAGMQENAAKRAEEAAFMRDFDNDFAARHAQAFATLHARINLDYFGIDCAETRDGALLLFEVDVAMIVHRLDDPVVFPYKRPVMDRMLAAFTGMLREAAAGHLDPT